MIKCPNCKKQTKPGEKTHHIVTAKRPRTYETQAKVRQGRRMVKKTIVSQGWEILSEDRVCGDCVPKTTNEPIIGCFPGEDRYASQVVKK